MRCVSNANGCGAGCRKGRPLRTEQPLQGAAVLRDKVRPWGAEWPGLKWLALASEWLTLAWENVAPPPFCRETCDLCAEKLVLGIYQVYAGADWLRCPPPDKLSCPRTCQISEGKPSFWSTRQVTVSMVGENFLCRPQQKVHIPGELLPDFPCHSCVSVCVNCVAFFDGPCFVFFLLSGPASPFFSFWPAGPPPSGPDLFEVSLEGGMNPLFKSRDAHIIGR